MKYPSQGQLASNQVPEPGSEPGSLALQADSLLSEPPGNIHFSEFGTLVRSCSP